MPLRTRTLLLVASLASAAPAALLQPAGWQLPLDADTIENPLKGQPEALASGRALYEQKCQRCHGATAEGNGPDADPDHRAAMDLTNPKRAGRNPDGIVFHKILSGRGRPKMPAFRDELAAEQIWAVVTYVQSLRKRP